MHYPGWKMGQSTLFTRASDMISRRGKRGQSRLSFFSYSLGSVQEKGGKQMGFQVIDVPDLPEPGGVV